MSTGTLPASFNHALPPDVDVVKPTVQNCANIKFLRPTHATLVHRKHDQEIKWSSRAHRKQRLKPRSPISGNERHAKSLWSKLLNLQKLEYWNISWWVAIFFTGGSIVWVVNAFQVFLPYVTKQHPEPGPAGWSAFVGATIFVFGSILLVIEAWNRDNGACFGYALKLSRNHRIIDDKNHIPSTHTTLATDSSPPKWIWFSLSPHFFREIGFLASFIQFWSATIFWISGFAGIEQLFNSLEKKGTIAAYWTPQVIGGCGFIISSALYMLECQKKWYIPELGSLGWHSAFWNLVGGIGFTLCGALGFSTKHSAQFQATCSTFWGSWAFLIGSIIQWYEAVNPQESSKVGGKPGDTSDGDTP